MNTQTQQVHAYMKTHGSITPWEGLMNLGVGRLSARIWELKKAGVEIKTEIKAVRLDASPNR